MRTKLFLHRLLRDRRGATAIEYGLIVSLIVIAIIGGMQSFGNASAGMWADLQDKVEMYM